MKDSKWWCFIFVVILISMVLTTIITVKLSTVSNKESSLKDIKPSFILEYFNDN